MVEATTVWPPDPCGSAHRKIRISLERRNLAHRNRQSGAMCATARTNPRVDFHQKSIGVEGYQWWRRSHLSKFAS
jgi:hypothetical protein